MRYIINGDSGNKRLVLAHGAGAGMDSEFMDFVAQGVAQQGIEVIRFEFPYMQQRRTTGKKRPPDKQSILLQSWFEILADLSGSEKVVIGGKSMGGRMASMVAAQQSVRGLVCLGYPFHPARKPESLRTEHLPAINCPTLFVQGERDALGNKLEVAEYDLPPTVEWCWLPDGDHDFKPRVRSGYTHLENLNAAVKRVAEFVRCC